MAVLVGCSSPPAEQPSWGALLTAPAGTPRGPKVPDPPEDCPTVEELHALVGQGMDAPGVIALKERLGEPTMRRDHAQRDWQDYPAHGLSVSAGRDDRVEVVSLRRREDGRPASYCGELPHGLDFGSSEKEVASALGPPPVRIPTLMTHGPGGEHRWVTEGYEVRFDLRGKRIRYFSLVRPLPRQATRISNVDVRADRLVRGLRSLEMTFDYATNAGRDGFGLDEMHNALLFHVGVLDAGGAPLKGRWPKSHHRDGEHLRFTQRARISYRGRTTIAIPYYLLDLAAGRHDVSLRVTAELMVDDVKHDSALQSPTLPRVTIQMPKVQWVSVGVSSIEVEDRPYDSFSLPDTAKPDIFWRLFYPSRIAELVFTSPVRSDRLHARFHERSPFFPVVEGDTVVIQVLDHDLTPHDDLGTFSLTLDDIEKAGSHRAGHVTALSFAPLRKRPR